MIILAPDLPRLREEPVLVTTLFVTYPYFNLIDGGGGGGRGGEDEMRRRRRRERLLTGLCMSAGLFPESIQ